jgi:hypothetical protein
VRTSRQTADLSSAVQPSSLYLRPLGSLDQFARRAAAEADAPDCTDGGVIQAAAAVSTAVGSRPYAAGDLLASKLKLDQFLLLRVGPFADVWERMVREKLEKKDHTAALIAAERATAGNPGWGCCVWLQSQLMAELGRGEERRDMALATLESPLWTVDARVDEVQRAARLEHVEDVHALFKEMDDRLRKQQGAPDRTPQELALLRAFVLLDGVVKEAGRWDAVRPELADTLDEAGLVDAATMARSA